MPITLAPTVTDPTDEQQALYWQGAMRGLTGERLARYAGVPVVKGSSPPVVSPAPVPTPGPTQWTNRAVAAPGTQSLNVDVEALNRLPVNQAQAAINAAMQYQGQRGYMRDIESGTKPMEALSRWAPLMFKSASGLPKMMQDLQQGKDQGDWIKTEVSPGIFALRVPGGKVPVIVESSKGSMSDKDRAKFALDAARVRRGTYDIAVDTPDYAAATNALSQAENLAGIKPIIPPPIEPPAEVQPGIIRRTWDKLFGGSNEPVKAPAPVMPTGKKKLTADEAEALLEEAGSRAEAEKLARERNYEW